MVTMTSTLGLRERRRRTITVEEVPQALIELSGHGVRGKIVCLMD